MGMTKWWHKVGLLNTLAAVLSGASLTVITAAVGYWLVQQPIFNIRLIKVEGNTEHIASAALEAGILSQLQGNLLTLDAEHLRDIIQTMPWVHNVSIRRLWPSQLIIQIQAHEPIAVWGEKGQLLSRTGQIFLANQAEVDHELPIFYGPHGSEQQVLKRYNDFSKWFKAIEATPKKIVLSSRYAWTVWLSNGTQVELGQEIHPNTLFERSERMIKAWSHITHAWGNLIDYVDCRYPSGLAISSANLRFLNIKSSSEKINQTAP